MRPEYVAQYEELERKHWWWLARRRILGSVLEELPIVACPGRKPRLLDIGCGAGLNLAALSDNFECAGLEPDPVLARAAQANSGAAIHALDLAQAQRSQPLGDQGFDCILLLDVIEHMDDDLGALRAAKGLLSPGGLLLVNVPALPRLWSVHDEANGHKRRYYLPQLRELISAAGLELLSLRYWGSLLVPLAYAERRLQKRPDPARYHVPLPHPRVNRILEGLVVREYLWTRRLRLPFGLSLFAAARVKS